MRVVLTKRGARLVEAGTIVSEILDRPGATHTFFDVLAAAITTLAARERVAILGFAGGGLVAPLRALGFEGPLDAVDLSLTAEPIFRRLSSGWCGRVNLVKADAARWLAVRRGGYDLILEDLFADGPRGMVKPDVSFTAIPGRIRARLRSGGVAVFNVLPEPGRTWAEIEGKILAPFEEARAVLLDEYENRLLVAGNRLPPAAALSRSLSAALARIGSRQAGRIAVRRVAPRR